MKKAILAIAVAALLTACNNGKGVNVGDNNKTTDSVLNSNTSSNLVDAIAIPIDTGQTWMKNYHQSVKFLDSSKGNVQLSFMLNANAIRAYLDQNKNITKMDMYLAINSKGTWTLVYMGAQDSIDQNNPKDTLYVEVPYFLSTDPKHAMPQVFDNGVPCPQCVDRVRIFNEPGSKRRSGE